MSAYEPLLKKPKAPPAPLRATVASKRPQPPIQTALEVSQPGDALELEADRVADHVLRSAAPAPRMNAGSDARIDREADKEEQDTEEEYAPNHNSLVVQAMLQRMCAKCDAEEDREEETPPGKLQRQALVVQRECGDCSEEEEEEQVQREAATPGPTAAAATPRFQAALSSARASGGEALPSAVRGFMEPRFGQDFRGVRVHRDAAASELTERVHAKAFTVGKDVFFRRGHFEPNSEQGKRLIAHELTHVVQQREGMRSVQRELLQREELEAPPAQSAQAAPAEQAATEEEALLANDEMYLEAHARGFKMAVNGTTYKSWKDPALEAFVLYFLRRYIGGSRDAALACLGDLRATGGIGFQSQLKPGQILNDKGIYGIEIDGALVQSSDAWVKQQRPGLRPVKPKLGIQKIPDIVSEGGGAADSAEEAVERFSPEGRILFPLGDGKIPTFVGGAEIKVAFQFTGAGAALGFNDFPHRINRVDFDWSISTETEGGKKEVDSGPLLEGGANQYSFDVEPGGYLVSVHLKSEHFQSGTELELKRPFEVIDEQARLGEAFDERFVGEGEAQPFELDQEGNLRLKPGAPEARSLKDQILELEFQIGQLEASRDGGGLPADEAAGYIEVFRERIEALKKLEQGSTSSSQYRIHGVFQSREDSSVREIVAVLHGLETSKEGQSSYAFTLNDFTLSPGKAVQHVGAAPAPAGDDRNAAIASAEGAALEALKERWRANNDYPDGHVRFVVPLKHGSGVKELTFDTHTLRKDARTALTVAAIGAGAVSIVLSGGTTAPVVLLVLEGVSLAAGAALAADEIARAIETNTLTKKQLVLNMLTLVPIAGSLARAGGITVRGMQLIQVSAGVAEGVLITAETQESLRAVMAEFAVQIAKAKTPEQRAQIERQRDQVIARLLGAAAVSGGISLVSTALGARGAIDDVRGPKPRAAVEGAEPHVRAGEVEGPTARPVEAEPAAPRRPAPDVETPEARRRGPVADPANGKAATAEATVLTERHLTLAGETHTLSVVRKSDGRHLLTLCSPKPCGELANEIEDLLAQLATDHPARRELGRLHEAARKAQADLDTGQLALDAASIEANRIATALDTLSTKHPEVGKILATGGGRAETRQPAEASREPQAESLEPVGKTEGSGGSDRESLTPEGAWREIDRFRTKAKGFEALGDRVPQRGDGLGTVALVEGGGTRHVFGVNSSSLSESSKDLGRKVFSDMKSKGFFPDTKHYGQGAAQVLTHAETHALMRAWENSGRRLGKSVTLFVDRFTCANCRIALPDVMRYMGIEELTIVTKSGVVIPLRVGG